MIAGPEISLMIVEFEATANLTQHLCLSLFNTPEAKGPSQVRKPKLIFGPSPA
jgi:hypothetical protein